MFSILCNMKYRNKPYSKVNTACKGFSVKCWDYSTNFKQILLAFPFGSKLQEALNFRGAFGVPKGLI